MDMYGQSTRRPQSLTPICIIGELMDSTDSEDFIQKCALCDKGFPNGDMSWHHVDATITLGA